MEKLYIISETSQSLGDTNITTIAGDWELESDVIHLGRLNWVGNKDIPNGCRYTFVSQSQFPPDFENFSWDYTNCDGIGSGSVYIKSWDTFKTENEI